jgi:hypothetical protein
VSEVRIAPGARRDSAQIVAYLLEHATTPGTATRFLHEFVVFYRPRADGIEVVRVFHAARGYEQFFGGD